MRTNAFKICGQFAGEFAGNVQLGGNLNYAWELLYDSESVQLFDSESEQLYTREIEN